MIQRIIDVYVLLITLILWCDKYAYNIIAKL